MRWKNFQKWEGRLPHWRAEDVTYFVSFMHRRPLTDEECGLLFKSLVRLEGRKFETIALCVVPNSTALILLQDTPSRASDDFGKVIDKVKTKVGRAIMGKSGERFPPFKDESYNRILRDQEEFEEHHLQVLEMPAEAEIVDDPDEYAHLWIQPVEPRF